MASFNPYFDAAPEDAIVLEGAIQDTCKALKIPESAKAEREVIAARIVDLAREGLHGRKALSERVLTEARTQI